MLKLFYINAVKVVVSSPSCHFSSTYCSEFVKKNRKMSKEIRELEYKIREEEQIAAQSAMSRGR